MTENPQISAPAVASVEVQPAPVATPAPEEPRTVLPDGNDVSDGIEPDSDEAPKPRLKRRELLEVSALLRRYKRDPSDPMAMTLGITFLQEKKAGETKLSFKDWLEEDVPEDEEDDEEYGEDEGPTQP